MDPDARTLEVYRLHQDPWPLLATFRETDPVQQPPFEALGFPHGSRLA